MNWRFFSVPGPAFFCRVLLCVRWCVAVCVTEVLFLGECTEVSLPFLGRVSFLVGRVGLSRSDCTVLYCTVLCAVGTHLNYVLWPLFVGCRPAYLNSVSLGGRSTQ
jgi:hypothetical protein